MSWDLINVFGSIIEDLDLARGFHLVDIAFEEYPKEPDSITHIVLKSLLKRQTNIRCKMMLKTLIKYLNYLLDNK